MISFARSTIACTARWTPPVAFCTPAMIEISRGLLFPRSRLTERLDASPSFQLERGSLPRLVHILVVGALVGEPERSVLVTGRERGILESRREHPDPAR